MFQRFCVEKNLVIYTLLFWTVFPPAFFWKYKFKFIHFSNSSEGANSMFAHLKIIKIRDRGDWIGVGEGSSSFNYKTSYLKKKKL